MTISYTMNFDGCSKSNPGPSGAGAVIYKDDTEIWSKAVYVGDKYTNNVAEYSGLIIGLEEANNMEISNLIVKGDSMLVIKQMKGEYKVKSLSLYPLYERAKTLAKKIKTIEYIHVYRKDNVRADKLSNDGLELICD